VSCPVRPAQVVGLLLRQGADFSLVDKEGRSAADAARNMGHQRCVRLVEVRPLP
jgi:ankyrin repeat protein